MMSVNGGPRKHSESTEASLNKRVVKREYDVLYAVYVAFTCLYIGATINCHIAMMGLPTGFMDTWRTYSQFQNSKHLGEEKPKTEDHQDRVAESGHAFYCLKGSDKDADYIIFPSKELQAIEARMGQLVASIGVSGLTSEIGEELRSLARRQLTLNQLWTQRLAEYQGARLKALREAAEEEARAYEAS